MDHNGFASERRPARSLCIQSILNPEESEDTTVRACSSQNTQKPTPISAGGSSLKARGPIDVNQSPLIRDRPDNGIYTRPSTTEIRPVAAPKLSEGTQRYNVELVPSRRTSQYPTNPSSMVTPQLGPKPAVLTDQSSYQLMTISSGYGPVQMAVDVQVASRMADEKRKRNAGASARFRARRKEKEIAASSKIQSLESQLRDSSVQLERYRVEREYLISIIQTLPGGGSLLRSREGNRDPM